MFGSRPILAAVAACLVVVPLGQSSSFAGARVSTHWAGYVDTEASFTSVEGTWVQPRVRCDRADSSASFWIGLGGATANATGLEQIGTSADCSTDFLPAYSAWYELIPVPSEPVELPLAVSPGDTLQAQVTVRGSGVRLAIRNLTTGEASVVEANADDIDMSSAEWIAEAPSACLIRCTTLPLAHFSRLTFRAAAATAGAHRGTIDDPAWTHEAVKLATTRREPAALPSSLTPDGSSFAVRWRGV